MGEEAGGAVLDALFIVDEVSSASLAQRIERAVAEKAVEVFPVCTGMAGKEFALFVAKIGIFFFFPVLIQTGSPQAPVWELFYAERARSTSTAFLAAVAASGVYRSAPMASQYSCEVGAPPIMMVTLSRIPAFPASSTTRAISFMEVVSREEHAIMLQFSL